MRWSIRNQIMLPVGALVLASVLGTSFISAYFVARQSDRHSFLQLHALVKTLSQSRIPFSAQVLQNIKGLSGAEFVAIDSDGAVTQRTAEIPADFATDFPRVPRVDDVQQLSQLPTTQIGGRNHFVARINSPYAPEQLYVLYPEGRLREAQWEAVFAPLVVGAVAAGLGVLLSIGLADRLARHIRGVREQLSLLSQRHFVQIDADSPVDELYELQLAANRLSQRLVDLEGEIVHSERLRLLAQLAGGLSHQLRNAVTGAKLAVQLHRRRCVAQAGDESLDIAERQLSLTEEQIKGMLALGARQRIELKRGDLAQLAGEVVRLMEPIAKHTDVRFCARLDLQPEFGWVLDADAVRAAIVNLVSNALEAAGTRGEVAIRTGMTDQSSWIEVEDSGSGPRQELQSSLFEPFVTSKTEGVGLGLFLVRQAADSTGGTIVWERRDERTVFILRWPRELTKLEAGAASVADERPTAAHS